MLPAAFPSVLVCTHPCRGLPMDSSERQLWQCTPAGHWLIKQVELASVSPQDLLSGSAFPLQFRKAKVPGPDWVGQAACLSSSWVLVRGVQPGSGQRGQLLRQCSGHWLVL